MDKKAIRRWRRDVFRTLKDIEQRWLATDQTFSAAMVLVGVSAVGTDVSALVELTGFSDIFVKKVLKRARRAKIIVGQTMRTGWDDEKSGWVAIVADALVCGLDEIRRAPDEKRSAAARARAITRKTPSSRRPRIVVAPGATFTPKQVKSDPLYIHEKYLNERQGK